MMQLTKIRSFAGSACIIPARVQYNVVYKWTALIEEHTGAAKAILPSKNKKGIYEERSIAVLSGWVVMNILETLERLTRAFINVIGVCFL